MWQHWFREAAQRSLQCLNTCDFLLLLRELDSPQFCLRTDESSSGALWFVLRRQRLFRDWFAVYAAFQTAWFFNFRNDTEKGLRSI